MMTSGPTGQEAGIQQQANTSATSHGAFGTTRDASYVMIEGEASIEYPFAQRYTALTQLSDAELSQAGPHAAQASATRKTIDTLENNIASLATSHGINEHLIRYAVTELITNATQYGAQGSDDPTCGHIHVAWMVDTTPHERSLRLTVGNPCAQLFDPSYYPRMLFDDFWNIGAHTNGHLFTISMLSLVKPETYMRYTWDLPSGERIACQMRKLENTPEEGQQARDGESLANQAMMCPVELSVTKSNSLNQPMSYSEAAFMEDVKEGIETKYLSISLILAEKPS